MRRLALLLSGVVLGAVSPLLGFVFVGSTLGQEGMVSGGIGLAREAWEAEHGAGEEGQNTVAYEGRRYVVQFRGGGVVPGVGVGRSGLRLPDGGGGGARSVPADARLAEGFAAPATAGGPIGPRIQRYESRAVREGVPAFAPAASGGILVISFETPAPDRFEPNVSRVSVSVGSAP